MILTLLNKLSKYLNFSSNKKTNIMISLMMFVFAYAIIYYFLIYKNLTDMIDQKKLIIAMIIDFVISAWFIFSDKPKRKKKSTPFNKIPDNFASIQEKEEPPSLSFEDDPNDVPIDDPNNNPNDGPNYGPDNDPGNGLGDDHNEPNELIPVYKSESKVEI